MTQELGGAFWAIVIILSLCLAILFVYIFTRMVNRKERKALVKAMEGEEGLNYSPPKNVNQDIQTAEKEVYYDTEESDRANTEGNYKGTLERYRRKLQEGGDEGIYQREATIGTGERNFETADEPFAGTGEPEGREGVSIQPVEDDVGTKPKPRKIRLHR